MLQRKLYFCCLQKFGAIEVEKAKRKLEPIFILTIEEQEMVAKGQDLLQ